MQHLALFRSESSTGTGNHVPDTDLCHRQNIELSFDNIYLVCFLNRCPCLVQSIEIFTFSEKNRFSRIFIFSRLIINRPPCKAYNLTCLIEIWEQNTLPKYVFEPLLLFIPIRDTGSDQIILLISFSDHCPAQPIKVKSKTQSIEVYYLLRNFPLCQIGFTLR